MCGELGCWGGGLVVTVYNWEEWSAPSLSLCVEMSTTAATDMLPVMQLIHSLVQQHSNTSLVSIFHFSSLLMVD